MFPVDGSQGLSPSVSFLGLGCSLPGIHIHGEGDHVSRSRATKKGRAESSEEWESSHLAKKPTSGSPSSQQGDGTSSAESADKTRQKQFKYFCPDARNMSN